MKVKKKQLLKKISDEMMKIKILETVSRISALIGSNMGSVGVFAAFWLMRKKKQKKINILALHAV